MEITVTTDITAALDRLNASRDQVPFAIAVALTKTAKDIQAAIKSEMASVFQSPTSYTLNSTYVKPATKTEQVAQIGIKDQGVAPQRWLLAEVYGGDRHVKALENVLRRSNVLPPGMFIVIASGAKTDSHGNMASSQIADIVNFFSSGSVSSDTLKRLRNRKQPKTAKQFFALQTKRGSLPPGIYSKSRNSVKPLLIFVRPPAYHRRLDFFGIAQRIAQENFPAQFDAALRQAMASAR